MVMVDVDGSSQFSVDSQPKWTGLVWGLAATRRSVYIHQMNRVNLGMVELCAKNLQIMRNDFTDYARTFCQLCAPST